MLEKHILNQIAKELLVASGNCSYDPKCEFSYGDRCSAPEAEFKKKFAQACKGKVPDCGFCSYTLADWPCANIITIRFVDNTLEHQENRNKDILPPNNYDILSDLEKIDNESS